MGPMPEGGFAHSLPGTGPTELGSGETLRHRRRSTPPWPDICCALLPDPKNKILRTPGKSEARGRPRIRAQPLGCVGESKHTTDERATKEVQRTASYDAASEAFAPKGRTSAAKALDRGMPTEDTRPMLTSCTGESLAEPLRRKRSADDPVLQGELLDPTGHEPRRALHVAVPLLGDSKTHRFLDDIVQHPSLPKTWCPPRYPPEPPMASQRMKWAHKIVLLRVPGRIAMAKQARHRSNLKAPGGSPAVAHGAQNNALQLPRNFPHQQHHICSDGCLGGGTTSAHPHNRQHDLKHRLAGVTRNRRSPRRTQRRRRRQLFDAPRPRRPRRCTNERASRKDRWMGGRPRSLPRRSRSNSNSGTEADSGGPVPVRRKSTNPTASISEAPTSALPR